MEVKNIKEVKVEVKVEVKMDNTFVCNKAFVLFNSLLIFNYRYILFLIVTIGVDGFVIMAVDYFLAVAMPVVHSIA